jgi:hypothetical protein
MKNSKLKTTRASGLSRRVRAPSHAVFLPFGFWLLPY